MQKTNPINQKYSINNHHPMKSFFYGLLCLFIMLVSVPAFAQIGIGTKTPAPSAALEVTSSTNNKGILIPRVTATQKNAIASPAEGLLVYQTTAPIGFYYYTGGAWKLMAIQTDLASKVDKVNGKDLSSNDYTTTEKTKLLAITGTNTGDQTTITGNAGTATKLASPRTINGVAFDGTANITVTADAGTLTGSFTKDITVNSVNIGRGNGENGSNTRIGGQALNSNTLGYQNVAIGDASLSNNTTGGRNNAIGTNALFKNTTGSENTAIGTFALENNTNGNRNLAIGQQTLFTNTEGIKNVALGYIPLYSNTTGSNNNAIGDETLFYNTTGNYNIGIGSQAGLTISTGSQNTMIGAQADVESGALTNATALGFRAKVSASNTIQLGNTNVTNVKTSGTVTAAGFTSTVATGTAPLVVTSTTPVANLSIGGNAATVTTNANLTGPVTSVGNATTITDGAITTASIADGAITNAKVTDVAASKITGTFTSATVNGKVIVGASSAASSSAVLEASSTTQGFLPPRMTEAQRNAISSAVAGLVVWCSDCGSNGELQVHNGTTWKNMIGGTVANTMAPVTIGQAALGGKIAYILQSGDFGYDPNVQHGLVATTADISTGVDWGCYGTTISGADGTAIGTGNQNTIDIMNGCATAGIPARLCGDLVQGGYSDWYLPSKDELKKLYLNRVAIGSFSGIYWSSSEDSSIGAWAEDFTSGPFQGNYTKAFEGRVRAVRAF
jgi:hypothetical protein